jgi:hypothetical protein
MESRKNQPKTHARDQVYIMEEEVRPVKSEGGVRSDRLGTIKLGGGLKTKINHPVH